MTLLRSRITYGPKSAKPCHCQSVRISVVTSRFWRQRHDFGGNVMNVDVNFDGRLRHSALMEFRAVSTWYDHIFFLHIVNIRYVVLEWVCKIWTKFSEAKLRHVNLNGFARLARYLRFYVLWKPNSRRGRETMIETDGKSSKSNNKPPTGNTSRGIKHTK